jgi:hypothetical protein
MAIGEYDRVPDGKVTPVRIALREGHQGSGDISLEEPFSQRSG